MDKKSLIKNLLITFIYAIFTLILVFHHEIWADEAQVWQICKYLNIPDLFKHLVNEGHPSFFYLLIMPFAKLLHGTNAILSMQLICWACCSAAVFLLWQFSPFDKRAKTAITLSAGFLYFLPVIARSYSVIPLVVFLLATLYPKRFEKPILYGILIAVCANIHVIMFGFCAALTILFFIESVLNYNFKENSENFLTNTKNFFKNKSLAGFSVMLLGLLAVIIQLHGTTDSNIFIKYDFSNLVESTKKVISQFFINPCEANFQEQNNILLYNIPLIILSAVSCVILWIILFFNSKKWFLISASGILFQLLVYILAYNHWIFVNRIFCAHLILLFAFWVTVQESEFKPKFGILGKSSISVLLTIFFLSTVFNGLRFCLMEIFNNYSGAKETAEFIEKNIDKNSSFLITDNDPYCISLLYYLNDKYEIYSAAHNKNISYITWDKSLQNYMTESGWLKYFKEMRKVTSKYDSKNIYVIESTFQKYKFGIILKDGFKKVFESKPSIMKYEGYVIYEYQK